MTDLHQMVINNISKMVGRKPVILHDHLIINHAVVENYFSMNDVLELCLASWHLHSHDVALSVRFTLLNFCCRLVKTMPVVHRLCILLSTDFYSHLLQALSRAKAAVCVTSLVTLAIIVRLPRSDGHSTFDKFGVFSSRCKDHVRPSRSGAFDGKLSLDLRPNSCRTISACL